MKFSIVIPNYNSAKWIIRLLDSIKNQTYKDYEVIIVDDISQDNSVDLIKKYKGLNINLIELNKKRFNGGTRNVGVEAAKGDYVLFADCDDFFYSNKAFEVIAKIIDARLLPSMKKASEKHKPEKSQAFPQ